MGRSAGKRRAYDYGMVPDGIERRWTAALVGLRHYATFRSEGWWRTATAIDRTRERLADIREPDALASEYIATVLLKRVKVDDATTQPSPFVRDASFALRYVELCTGLAVSAAAPPSWLGEWAVAEP